MVLKRIFDFVVSLLALLVLSPLLIILGLAVYFKLGRPVFYVQTRAGKNGEPFKLYKLRTMSNVLDANGNLLPDEQRLTSFGLFLRRASLDELPELWNVLCGKMSLVGPRPLLMRYLPRYTPEQMRRHEAKPGITGWAQIHGRNTLSWEDKFKQDVWYVDNRSFGLDVKILASTLVKIFKKEGISADGHATMPEFRGSNPTR